MRPHRPSRLGDVTMKTLAIALLIAFTSIANAEHVTSKNEAIYDATHLQERATRLYNLLRTEHPGEHLTQDARMVIEMASNLARAINQGNEEEVVKRYAGVSEHIHHMQDVISSDAHLKQDSRVKMQFFSVRFAKLELEMTLGYDHKGHEHGEEGEDHDHKH